MLSDLPVKRILLRSIAAGILTFALAALLYMTLGTTMLAAVLFASGCGVIFSAIHV